MGTPSAAPARRHRRTANGLEACYAGAKALNHPGALSREVAERNMWIVCWRTKQQTAATWAEIAEAVGYTKAWTIRKATEHGKGGDE